MPAQTPTPVDAFPLTSNTAGSFAVGYDPTDPTETPRGTTVVISVATILGFAFNRSNHTGTQPVSSITDFDAEVVSAVNSELGGTDWQTQRAPQVTETPAGTTDGVNTIFTLSAGATDGSLLLDRNGVVQKQGDDYTRPANSATITFTLGAVPVPSDSLRATYVPV